MITYRIFIDSLCDIPSEKAKEYNVSVLPYLFEVSEDHKEYLTTEVSSEQVEEWLSTGIPVKTSRPALNIWVEMIEKAFSEGYDVFYLASTSKMTGAFASVRVIHELLKPKYPERTLLIEDTLLTANAQTCILEELLSEEPSTIKSIAECAHTLAKKTFYMGSLYSTDIFVNNHRLEERNSNYPRIIMTDGTVRIEGTYPTRRDSIASLLEETTRKDCSRVDISYASNLENTTVGNVLKPLAAILSDKGIACSLHKMNSCMYTYLGLGAVSISYIER